MATQVPKYLVAGLIIQAAPVSAPAILFLRAGSQKVKGKSLRYFQDCLLHSLAKIAAACSQ